MDYFYFLLAQVCPGVVVMVACGECPPELYLYEVHKSTMNPSMQHHLL